MPADLRRKEGIVCAGSAPREIVQLFFHVERLPLLKKKSPAFLLKK
jgi:hypothetical protein